MFYKWYWKHLTMSYVQRCGCMDIRSTGHCAIDRLVVCEKHAERIREIVAKRKPLEGHVPQIEE